MHASVSRDSPHKREREGQVFLRRHQLAIALAMAAALTLAGCAQQPGGTSPLQSPHRIRVSGSGTALPLIRILSDAYESDEVAFVYLPGLHTGGGIKGAANGDLEIGSVSRELTVEEKALDLDYVQLSDDGLVIATHPSVTIDGLTTGQVRDIYAGEYENWSELGGPDLDIVILDRNEDESAKLILREFVLGPDLEITEHAVIMFYEPDMVDGLEKTEGAIGYFSLGYGVSEEISVNYLELDGVEPTVASIESGDYKMVRPLGMVAARPASAPIAEFLEWSKSEEAIALMREQGFARPLADSGDR